MEIKYNQGLIRRHPEYNREIPIIPMTPELDALSTDCEHEYTHFISRNPPLTIERDKIIYNEAVKLYDAKGNALLDEKGNEVKGSRKLNVLAGVENETISDDLAIATEEFERVELLLPFFSKFALDIENNRGLSMQYGQWIVEEQPHGPIYSEILVLTGHRTREQNDVLHSYLLRLGWTPPFDSYRKMVAYAAMQEKATLINTDELAAKYDAEGAPISARAIRLIGKDEGYHSGNFIRQLRVFHKHDPEGTLDDIYTVGTNFEMPSQDQMSEKAGKVLKDMKIFRSEVIPELSIRPVLRGLGFVPQNMIDEIVRLQPRKKAA